MPTRGIGENPFQDYKSSRHKAEHIQKIHINTYQIHIKWENLKHNRELVLVSETPAPIFILFQ